MKKILILLALTIAILSLASCGSAPAENPGTVTETEAVAPETNKAEAVTVGNKITVDFAEIAINEAQIANDIKQSISSGSITYTTGPDSSDATDFVYIRGTLKNTSKAEINNPEIVGNVEIDGYTYELDCNLIEKDGSSAYSISPLMEYTYTLYAEVPNELIANWQECKVNFGFGESFSFSINSIEEADYQYSLALTK